jgi:hypothetical protein
LSLIGIDLSKLAPQPLPNLGRADPDFGAGSGPLFPLTSIVESKPILKTCVAIGMGDVAALSSHEAGVDLEATELESPWIHCPFGKADAIDNYFNIGLVNSLIKPDNLLGQLSLVSNCNLEGLVKTHDYVLAVGEASVRWTS